MVFLVKCYSRFLQSSISRTRLDCQKAATWSLYLAYTIYSCLWKLLEIHSYQTVSIKKKQKGRRENTCSAFLNSPGFFSIARFMWTEFNWNTTVSAKLNYIKAPLGRTFFDIVCVGVFDLKLNKNYYGPVCAYRRDLCCGGREVYLVQSWSMHKYEIAVAAWGFGR